MFKRIYFFFFSYLIAISYGQSLLFLWFFKNGVPYNLMLLFCLFNFASPIIIFSLLEGKSINSRKSLFLGILASAGGVLLASNIVETWQVLMIGLLFGVTNVFFWTIYNAIYFKYSSNEEYGYKSSVYSLFFSFIGAVCAPLAGLVAAKLGYPFLFTSALFIYLIPLVLVFSLPSFLFQFKTKEATFKIENKILIFFQGYNSIIGMSLIPIFTLYFISTPLELGNFFGYLALLAAFAAVINSKISDKIKKRASFFYFFTVFNVLSYWPIAFASSVILWQVFTGINNITTNLANPFSLALILDYAKLDMETTMLGREIYLNLGRVAMLSLSLFVFWYSGSFFVVLAAGSFSTMLYPIAAYYQKVYLK